jgi:hypothetical protein
MLWPKSNPLTLAAELLLLIIRSSMRTLSTWRTCEILQTKLLFKWLFWMMAWNLFAFG